MGIDELGENPLLFVLWSLRVFYVGRRYKKAHELNVHAPFSDIGEMLFGSFVALKFGKFDDRIVFKEFWQLVQASAVNHLGGIIQVCV